MQQSCLQKLTLRVGWNTSTLLDSYLAKLLVTSRFTNLTMIQEEAN